MIILYTGILLIFYSIISGRKYKPEIGFLFVFLIMAFQSNVDGDYMGYMESFIYNEASRTVEDEPLWDLVTMPFHYLGKFGWYAYVFFLSLFQYFVVSRLVKRYVEGRFQYLGAILFFFTFGMMLIQMKAMRQGLAIELSLLPYLFNIKGKKRQWLYCFAPVVAAYFVHNSAIVAFIPVALYYIHLRTGLFDKSRGRSRGEWFWPVVMAGIFYFVYTLRTTLFSGLFMELSSMLTMNDMRLGGYLAGNEIDEVFDLSYLIVLYDAVIVFFSTWYYTQSSSSNRIFAIMSIIAAYCDTLFFGMGSMARIGYFFLVADIVVLSNVANLLDKRFGKQIALIFVVFCIAYAFKTSLPWITGNDPDRFGVYKFIFM